MTARALPLAVLLSRMGTPHNYYGVRGEQNGMNLGVGQTRGGKSIYYSYLIGQFRQYGGSITILDSDFSHRISTLWRGGAHFDPTDEKQRFKCNPMRALQDGLAGRQFCVSWCRAIAGFNEKLTDDEITDLDDAIKLAFDEVSIGGKIALRDVVNMCSVPSLKKRFSEWVGDGPRAALFDHYDDDFSSADFVCFEAKKYLEDVGIGIHWLSYMFYNVMRKLKPGCPPSLICLEEAWRFYGDPRARPIIVGWARTLLKMNCWLWSWTQSFAEFKADPLLRSFAEGMGVITFFANTELRDSASLRAEYQEGFSLTESHCAQIAGLLPYKEVLIKIGSVSRIVQINMPPTLLAVLRSESAYQSIFNVHYRPEDPDWRKKYLDAAVAFASNR
jgi:type IV secretion system protein TrbE